MLALAALAACGNLNSRRKRRLRRPSLTAPITDDAALHAP